VLGGALCGVRSDGGLQGFGLVTTTRLEGDEAGRGEVTRSPLQQAGGGQAAPRTAGVVTSVILTLICLCLTIALPCPVLPSRQALTRVAAEDEAASNSAAVPGGSLLEREQYHAGQRRKLLVLQLVATLCESVSDTVFTDVAQVGHGKALGDQQLERVADQALGHWALRRRWLRNSWRKLEHPQEKQFIDSVASVSARHRPVQCQREGQSQLQREEGAAQQSSPYLGPWLCIKSQESRLCVNQNSDLRAARLYFEQNLFPSSTKLKDICT